MTVADPRTPDGGPDDASSRRVDHLERRIEVLEGCIARMSRCFTTERLIVETPLAVIKLGEIYGTAGGVRAEGRGPCRNTTATLMVDDGTHSVPVIPRAEVVASSNSGLAALDAPGHPMEVPSVRVGLDMGAGGSGPAVTLTARHLGYGEPDVDGKPPPRVVVWSCSDR